MPILDPSFQFFLIRNSTEGDEGDEFFMKYLLIASRCKDLKQLNILKASHHFKEDLKKSYSYINAYFKCTLRKEDFNNISINDYYQYLFKNIAFSIKKKDNIIKKKNIKTEIEGNYYICTDQFETKLYRPNILFPQSHVWFFSDTPIAILCINPEKLHNDQIIEMIKLEIDLLEGSGFTLVLCANYSSTTIDRLFQLIQDDQFSEVHLNIFDKSFVPKFYKNYDTNYKNLIDKCTGYFYLYSHFLDKDSPEKIIYRELKNKQRFQIINFSGLPEKFTNDIELISTDPFPYCVTGFQNNYIRIRLSNIPLYDKKNDKDMFTPSQVSGLGIGYINPNFFLNWRDIRIEILFEDPTKKDHIIVKYINYDDIHKMRPYLYTNDPLSLVNIDENMFKLIDNIQENVKNKIDDEVFYLFLTQLNKFIDTTAKFTRISRNDADENTKNFTFYRTQLLTAYEAYKKIMQKGKNGNKKGLIYQVETGEGKSMIVNLIAALVVKAKKNNKDFKVHIASSNIELSKRDFMKSYRLFKQMDIQTAVLLHDTELPFSIKNNEKNKKNEKSQNIYDNDPYMNYFKETFENIDNEDFKSYSNNDFYGEKCFKNPSKMNFAVCGYDFINMKNDKSNKVKVIFSTFVNFECFYLKLNEAFPGDVDNYYNNCLLLIDEADSILIDEITNGTIISRPMNSNMEKILKYVYNQKEEGKKAEDIYKDLVNENKFKSGIGDLKLEDVQKMYEDIDTVQQEDFEDGKKYIIESYDMDIKENYIFDLKKFESLVCFGIKVFKFIKKTLMRTKKELDKKEGKVVAEDDDDDDDDDDDGDDDDDDDDEEEEKNDVNEKKKEEKKIKSKNQNENDNESNDSKDKTQEEKKKSKTITYRYIVPFDFDHKGIVEPNKEFSGFVQQFIAIKESKNGVENMLIKGQTMSYLYISHPLFVKLYGNVFGFTGTIGNKEDREIYEDHYMLDTMKIPRQNPNQRVDFPMIICKTPTEQYNLIVSEVIEMHKNNIPVLVIFQDRNDIDNVGEKLIKKGITNINIFDGKDDLIKPDLISGIEGSVSLGTNVCGRGTDIEIRTKALHVIVGYYSTNIRVMKQAFGRTARKGQKGTCRVICLESQYNEYPDIFEENETNEVKTIISKFDVKNKKQKEFIKHIQNMIGYVKDERRFLDHFVISKSKIENDWLFTSSIDKQVITKEQIESMRKSRINVNRIVAFNYSFPIRMKVETFLKIQAQKIFSLLNCPNSIFTWRLFRRYVREMILESWSLMMNEIDDKYEMKPETSDTIKEYEKDINDGMNGVYLLLKPYFPPKNHGEKSVTPISMFIHIFEKIRDHYDEIIFGSFKKIKNPILYPITMNKTLNRILEHARNDPNNKNFFSKEIFSDPPITRNASELNYQFPFCTGCYMFNFGFYPFSAISESGAKVSFRKFNKTNYIKDPELSYEKRTSDNRITVLSITEKIDEVFDCICRIVAGILGEKTFLKLYLKRTLCGGEFGIYLNANFIESDINDPLCLVDKDAIVLISLKINSIIPILSGILIIFLVYIASIVYKFGKFLSGFPTEFSTDMVITGLTVIAEDLAKKASKKLLDKAIDLLKNQLSKQIKDLGKNKSKEKIADFLSVLMVIFDSKIFDYASDNVSEEVGEKTNKIQDFIKSCEGFPGFNKYVDLLNKKLIGGCLDSVNACVLKLSFLILMNFAAFILNFISSTNELEYSKKDAKNFDNDPTKKNIDDLVKNEEKRKEEEEEKEEEQQHQKDKK